MKKILVFLLFLCCSSMVWAADSQGNRKNKNVHLGVSTGIHFPSAFATPFNVGYYINDKFLVGGEYGMGSYSSESGDADVTLSMSQFGAYGRWFPGNSFNVMGALHKRTWVGTGDGEITSLGVVTTSDIEINADALVATVGVGNHWMMDFGMVVGFDWALASVALSQSVSSSVDAQDNRGNTLTQAQKDELEDDADKIGDLMNTLSASPGLLVFQFGWAF